MRIGGDTDKNRQKYGSRNSDGNVPNANWNDEFGVGWYYVGDRDDSLRPREEVSHQRGHGSGSFGVNDFIQLFISLEIFMICSDSRKYTSSSMIFNSFSVRRRFCRTPFFIRNLFKVGILFPLVCKADSMESDNISTQISSKFL